MWTERVNNFRERVRKFVKMEVKKQNGGERQGEFEREREVKYRASDNNNFSINMITVVGRREKSFTDILQCVHRLSHPL